VSFSREDVLAEFGAIQEASDYKYHLAELKLLSRHAAKQRDYRIRPKCIKCGKDWRGSPKTKIRKRVCCP
jgi:hypothetical protein